MLKNKFKIIQISIGGFSGQPTVAGQLHIAIGKVASIRTIFINKNSSKIRRLFLNIYLGYKIKNSNRNFIIHLGIESLLLRSLFSLKGKAVFINHGIYKFTSKTNILRNIYIFLDRLATSINDVFFVNRAQANSCGSLLFFSNTPCINGLVYASREARPITSIGFIGPEYGQKNIKVLLKAVQDNKQFNFFHLSKSQIYRFVECKNYLHIPESDRLTFFRQLDVLLIPSIYESFGLAAYEAAYCGVHVIHSGVDGLMNLSFGEVIASNTPDAWSSAVQALPINQKISFGVFKPNDDMDGNVEKILNCFFINSNAKHVN